MNDREFIIDLKKYIPTRCRDNTGCDFDLRKLHYLIEQHLGEEKEAVYANAALEYLE